MTKCSPAHILMSHGGKQHHKSTHDKFSTARAGKRHRYATGGYAEGGDTYASGGDTYSDGGDTMRRGGRRHRAMGGDMDMNHSMPPQLMSALQQAGAGTGRIPPLGANPGSTSPSAWRNNPDGKRQAMQAFHEKYPGYAEGGYAEGGNAYEDGGDARAPGWWPTTPKPHADGGEAMRRGGRRHAHHHAHHGRYANINPHSGHHQYFWLPLLAGLAGSILPGLLGGGGQQAQAHAKGGFAEGGEPMRRGGRRRRHRDGGGDMVPLEGKAKANAMGGRQMFQRSSIGGNRPFAEGGEADDE